LKESTFTHPYFSQLNSSNTHLVVDKMDSTKKPESQKGKIKKLANKMTETNLPLLDSQRLENRVKDKTILTSINKKNREYGLCLTRDPVNANVLHLETEISLATNCEN